MEALPCLRRLASWLEPSVPEASPPWRTACRAQGTTIHSRHRVSETRPSQGGRCSVHHAGSCTGRHAIHRTQRAQQAQQAQRQLTTWERASEGMPVVTWAPAASTRAAASVCEPGFYMQQHVSVCVSLVSTCSSTCRCA